MNKKYLLILTLMSIALVAGSAQKASADEVGNMSEGGRHAIDGRRPMGGLRQSGVFGTVTALNGALITINTAVRPNSTDTVKTFSIDATNAKFVRNGTDASLASIVIGDRIIAEGPVVGQNVTATIIRDGIGDRGQKMGWEGATSSRSMMPRAINHEKGGTPTARQPLGNGQPVVGGVVSALNGMNLTVTNRGNVSYSVDATNAVIEKGGATTTVSGISLNDTVIVQGTVSDNTVAATLILDRGIQPSAPRVTPPVQKQSVGIWGNVKHFFGRFF